MANSGKSQRPLANIPEAQPVTPRGSRWPKLLGGTLVLLLVLVGLAPTIVAKGGLLGPLVNWAVPINGRIEIGSASLGWFSPPVISDIEIRDKRDEVVCQLSMLAAEKSLWALATDPSNLGSVKLDRPIVHVSPREEGNSLSDTFKSLWDKPKKPGSQPPVIDCYVQQGTVIVHDPAARREYRLEKLDIHAQLPGGGESYLVEVVGQVPTQSEPAGLKLNVKIRPPGNGIVVPSLEALTAQVRAFPLEMLQPLVQRGLDQAQLSGVLTADITTQQEAGGLVIAGTIGASDFRLAAPALQSDQIQLAQVRVPLRLVQRGDDYAIEQLGLNCELGDMTLAGRASLRDLMSGAVMPLMLHERYAMTGQLDLARLAQMLPATLHIRPGTQITSGQARLNLTSEPQPTGLVWTGRLETSPLTAMADGRKVEWPEPVAVDLAAHDTEAGPMIDRLACRSSFLQVEGTGTPQQMSATARFDLQRLADELAQFVDLAGLQLAGQGEAKLDWQQGVDRSFVARGELRAQGFQLVAAGKRPWREAEINARAEAFGSLEGKAVRQLDKFSLDVQAGREHLVAQLMQPVLNAADVALPLQLAWQGDFAAWLPRLEPWVDMSEWQVSGAGNLEMAVQYSSRGVIVDRGTLRAEQFHAWGPGWFVDEPRVDLALAGRWDDAAQQLDVTTGNLKADKLSVDLASGRLVTATRERAASASGTLTLDGDLAQLNRWTQDPRVPKARELAGHARGTAELANSAGVGSVKLRGQIDNFVMADLTFAASNGESGGAHPLRSGERVQPAGVWREERIDVALTGSYHQSQDKLQLDQGTFASRALRCELTGTIEQLTGVCQADVKGKLDYDWAQLGPLYRQFVPGDVNITGSGSKPFWLRGPLAGHKDWTETLAACAGEAGIDWQSATALGLSMGSAQLQASLDRGRLSVSPLDLPVSEGRLHLAPQFQLAPQPAVVTLPKGPLATQIRFSPELCARGLKFIAPVLAEATVAEGRFSIELDGGRMPLAAPKTADVGGKLMIHSVEVRPGPLAEQMIFLGQQVTAVLNRKRQPSELSGKPLLTMTNQNVEFRLVEGRVYHRGLEFMAGSVPVRTHGSVGLDESLALVAEIAIQDDWVSREPILAGLKGQTLEIPIEGTLSRPKLDRRSIDKLAGKLLENAARGAVFDQLNKLLQPSK